MRPDTKTAADTAHAKYRVLQAASAVRQDFKFLTNLRKNQRWRAFKLAQTNISYKRLMVPIKKPVQISAAEKTALRNNCRDYNLSFYRCASLCDPQTLLTFWSQLGLTDVIANPEADHYGLSHIQVKSDSRYIPYSDKPLLWHTDGYYNVGAKTIYSFAMHCIRPAVSGGKNYYFDPEILYLLIGDENPDYIRVLVHPLAMTIPANPEIGMNYRDEVSVPMLTYDNGKLLFRYTERTHAIKWRDDAMLTQARAFIRNTLRNNTRYRLGYKLNANEGIICNNVLHSRTAFVHHPTTNPEQSRLLYRARFHNAIA